MMAEFILYVATTVDGYIASTDGSIDWLTPFETSEQNRAYTAFYSTIDALVMGYTTYEQVLGFGDWSYAGKMSYVLTNRKRSTNRSDIVFKNSIEAVLEEIQRQQWKRVWVVGGGKVASLFIELGLIDEYILTVIPMILGRGISLYQSLSRQKLNLVNSKNYDSGAVELHYCQA